MLGLGLPDRLTRLTPAVLLGILEIQSMSVFMRFAHTIFAWPAAKYFFVVFGIQETSSISLGSKFRTWPNQSGLDHM